MQAPTLYADSSARFATQLLADVLFLCWVIGWVWAGMSVHEQTMRLAAPGLQAEESASQLAGSMTEAGEVLADLPLVGGEAAAPFESASAAADRLAAAGRAEVEAVEQLALWLGLAIATIPIAVVAARYVPRRVAFARTATAGRRLVDGAADLELFAWRALVHQPLPTLARVHDDPAGALRRGDPDVVRRLAALELRAAGLPVPATPLGGAATVTGRR